MPTIKESSIAKLMPTQITVGMIEVADKIKEILALKPDERVEFMRAHAAPAVTGPQCGVYVTDHHHFARAAVEAGVETGFFEIEADLSHYDPENFWKEMDKNLWVHPLDENGVRHYYSAIPHRLQDLVDDVYRSLAWLRAPRERVYPGNTPARKLSCQGMPCGHWLMLSGVLSIGGATCRRTAPQRA